MGSLEFVARHDHARNPEENDVRAGHEIVGRIKVFLFRRIFGPAHDRERPEPGAEPCVEHVFILTPSVALRRIHAHIDFVPVIIPCRNAVPPPDLAADAPVLDVFHPVEISLGPTLRIELDRAVADRLDCGFGEFVHFDEQIARQLARPAGCNRAVWCGRPAFLDHLHCSGRHGYSLCK